MADLIDEFETAAPDAEFQRTVLGGVKALREENAKLKTDVQKVTGELDRADKEVKKALEELTKVKNESNVSYERLMKAYDKLQKQVKLNARSSFGDPVQRYLAANPEAREYWNAVLRYCFALSQKDDGAALKSLPEGMRDLIVRKNEEARQVQKSLTGVDSSLGQATVPQETFDEIYDTLLEFGDYSTLGVMRVGMRTTVLPVATARPQSYWIGAQSSLSEGSVITSGAFTGSQVLLIIQTLACLMYVSRELLADSTVDLAPYVVREMAQSIAQGMDTAAFIGTGNVDTTNAGYVGIFNAASINANLAATAGLGGTMMPNLLLDDFVNATLTVAPIVLKRMAKWWMHPQMIAQAALIRDKMGRPIFQTFIERPDIKAIANILGYPVEPTAIAPTYPMTAGAQAGQPLAVFGDPEGQAIGIRADLELATSDDIGFPQNLRAFRTLLRAGVKTKTLAGSTTLKPFAVLTASLT